VTLVGIEDVIGTKHRDELFGDGERNRLNGLEGNDVLVGRGADDSLCGCSGKESIPISSTAAVVTISSWTTEGPRLSPCLVSLRQATPFGAQSAPLARSRNRQPRASGWRQRRRPRGRREMSHDLARAKSVGRTSPNSFEGVLCQRVWSTRPEDHQRRRKSRACPDEIGTARDPVSTSEGWRDGVASGVLPVEGNADSQEVSDAADELLSVSSIALRGCRSAENWAGTPCSGDSGLHHRAHSNCEWREPSLAVTPLPKCWVSGAARPRRSAIRPGSRCHHASTDRLRTRVRRLVGAVRENDGPPVVLSRIRSDVRRASTGGLRSGSDEAGGRLGRKASRRLPIPRSSLRPRCSVTHWKEIPVASHSNEPGRPARCCGESRRLFAPG
jgi:hypothetical protein